MVVLGVEIVRLLLICEGIVIGFVANGSLKHLVVELLDLFNIDCQISIPRINFRLHLVRALVGHILNITCAIKSKGVTQSRYLLFAIFGRSVSALLAVGVAEFLTHRGVISTMKSELARIGPM